MKKIALSVLVASTVALAACGGGAATNNAPAAEANALENAIDTMNEVSANVQDQANATTAAATNELSTATNELNAAAANVAAAH